jgi:Gly-Xaa carboxypeptidase
LIFTLNGTDDAVKPLLLTAHQDVVPIDDPTDWTYPPFSGYFDGQWLWGRGASDCKNVLIGLLSAVEDLLQQGWEPTRTIVLAFGFDEESHGWNGAGKIAKVLEERYGHDSFEFLLDEGGMGLRTLGDVVYALPGVGEKGGIDLHLVLSIDGGHSSVPPAHTGIGIIAEIIYHLEREDLFVPRLDEKHPSRQTLECQAQHSPESVEPWLASALESDDYVGLAEAVAESRGAQIRFTYQTSQAVDLIKGGVKINALPEKINATVNYRVALHESPEDVKTRAVKIIKPIVEKYNLTFNAFGSGNEGDGSNQLDLIVPGLPLVPAPISPTDVQKDTVWARFSGVARSVFESVPSLKGKKVVVSGDVMTGNTDTQFYWNLTRNIYRWSPTRVGGEAHIHTVDERIDIAVHLEGLALYYG